MSTASSLDNFWQEWAKLGKDMVDYGAEIGFGNSFIELKFRDGIPAIIVHSKQISTMYPNHDAAERAIAQILHNSQSAEFDGARTFTVAYHKGKIKQVILDEYGNRLIV